MSTKSPRTKKGASSALQTGPPPVAPKPRLLPFYAPAFSWDTFENFFCDFLAAGPKLIGKDGKTQRIVSTSLYGRRGDKQHGIDIRAEIANGEVWVFQCKHYKSWGPEDTRDVITKCEYTADRKFLLVTRTVSPETRNEIAKHADWQIWDSDDISREFFARLSPETAARLLYTNFGPAWPKELLDLPGLGPLYTSDARFAPFLEERRTFHHRLPLIGRKDWLKSMDDFIVNEQERVLIICGRGGVGKSRILREWSQGFSYRHNGWTLRFVSDSPSDFGPAIDASSHPLVLVFDDAHRLDEVRRALFSQLPSRKNVKLVLSLRPGPIAQVEVELTEAGFDARQIKNPTPLKRLSSEHALELAEAALGPELSERFRLRLRDLSKDCPLLAVLAAELLKTGELAHRDLTDIAEFRIHVFGGLLSEARPVEERFGATTTRDVLRLLALLAPVKIDANFLKNAATFLGAPTQPSHISDIIEAIENVGLLITTGAGVRVTPDLLSDHLSYTACYDKRGNDTTFTGRVFQHFPLNQFPRLLQHVAEAEWHALQENFSAQSVVAPIWQGFLERFEQSSFYARHEQLKQWANIAHLQPSRTLELAQLAVHLQDAPPAEETIFGGKYLDSHGYVLSALPALLKPLAKNNPGSVAACLDILWSIGKNLPPPPMNAQGHPIVTIGEIASYDGGGFPAVHREVLDWLKRLFRGNEWTDSENKPAWLMRQMLHSFFSISTEQRWSAGRTFHWRTLLIPLGSTEEFREGVRGICQDVIAKNSVPLALATLGVLAHAMRRPQILGQEVPPDFEQMWLAERRKALAILAKVEKNFNAATVHYRLREVLLQVLKFERTEFSGSCRLLFEVIPDTLDLRLLRTTMESYWHGFERPKKSHAKDWQVEAKRRWDQFVRSTVNALIEAYPDPQALLAKLQLLHHEATSLGFNPNFKVVFGSIADHHGVVSLDLARQLIAEPSHPLGWALGLLLFTPTSNRLKERLSFCAEAVATGADELIAGAIDCLAWWRRDSVVPDEAWSLLTSLAGGASVRVAGAIAQFVHLNDDKPTQADWGLLAAVPAHAENLGLRQLVFECASNLLKVGALPSPEIAEAVLAKLEHAKSLNDHNVEQALAQFATRFPGKVFLLVWRRHHFYEAGESELEPLPYDFDSISFANVMVDPDAAKVVALLQDRLLNGEKMSHVEHQILRIPVMQSNSGPEPALLRLLEMAETPQQIARVAAFAKQRDSWPIVLECAGFTRQVLMKARTASGECHREVFQRLLSLPGARGFGGIEPDDEWKALVDALEKVAQLHAGDPELGPFYAAALKHERDWIADMRKSGIERERAFEDDLE